MPVDSGLAALDADVGWVAVPSLTESSCSMRTGGGREATDSGDASILPQHPFAYVVRTGRPPLVPPMPTC